MADWKPNCEKPQTPLGRFIPNPKLKFMEQCREVMRFKRLALRSEQAYLEWIKRFLVFHRQKATPHPAQAQSLTRPAATLSHPMGEGHVWRRPEDMGVAEVRAFLTYLANERNVSASTQNQALNALLFLYRHVLDRGLEFVEGFERARRSQKVPVVLTKAEAGRLLAAVPERYRVFCQLLYGTWILSATRLWCMMARGSRTGW
jgi:integrase